MEQVTLDEAIKQEAIDRAGANANQEWREKAYAVILEIARTKRLFTTDDVWAQLEKGELRTHEPRALGALMQKLLRERVVFTTGAYRKSTRRACHGRPIPIYVSREA